MNTKYLLKAKNHLVTEIRRIKSKNVTTFLKNLLYFCVILKV